MLLLCAAPPNAAARAVSDAPDADFAGPGGCAVDARTTVPVTLPPESGCGRDCSLQLHVTGPAAAPPAARRAAKGDQDANEACKPPPGGRPVLFFYSGFQLRAAYYEGYARRLASWGWAVVQYDLALLDLVPAGVEVRVAVLGIGLGCGLVRLVGIVINHVVYPQKWGLSPRCQPPAHPCTRRQAGYTRYLLRALEGLNADPSSRWYGRLDLSTIATTGHRCVHPAPSPFHRLAVVYVDTYHSVDVTSHVASSPPLHPSIHPYPSIQPHSSTAAAASWPRCASPATGARPLARQHT
jgi:hypothetical protein